MKCETRMNARSSARLLYTCSKYVSRRVHVLYMCYNMCSLHVRYYQPHERYPVAEGVVDSHQQRLI
jgi:hypothetical protein